MITFLSLKIVAWSEVRTSSPVGGLPAGQYILHSGPVDSRHGGLVVSAKVCHAGWVGSTPVTFTNIFIIFFINLASNKKS